MEVIQTKVLEKPETVRSDLSPASRPLDISSAPIRREMKREHTFMRKCLTMMGQKLEDPTSLHASDARPRSWIYVEGYGHYLDCH